MLHPFVAAVALALAMSDPQAGPNWPDHLTWRPSAVAKPNVTADDIIGEWFLGPHLPNAGAEWHAFLPDSTYVHYSEGVDCNDRVVARVGRWKYERGTVAVTVTAVVRAEGGRIELEGVSVPSTIIGARPVRTGLANREQMRFAVESHFDIDAGERLMRFSLRNGGVELWKQSHDAVRYRMWSPGVALPSTIDVDSSCESVGAREATLRRVQGRCGFSIRIPDGWRVAKAEPWQVKDSCSVELRRGTKRMLTLELFSARSDQICRKTLICYDDERRDWGISGRAGATNPATVIDTPLWRELVGVSATGWYGADGNQGYQGSAQVFVALLDDRKGTMAMFVGSQDLEDEALFRRIVSSMRFGTD